MECNEIKVGQRFGKLVVLSTHESYYGNDYCLCNCDCGSKGIMAHTKGLLSGDLTSCYKCKYKHNKNKPKSKTKIKTNSNELIKHPLYRVWNSMIMRCENPKRPYYYLYGGRGIKVCDEWRKDYLAFYEWSMQNGYKFEPFERKDKSKRIRNKWTLDRIDLNGDYCPENCRWIDHKQQNENKRHNLIIEIDGEQKKVIEWLRQFNSTTNYFYYLLRQGMSEQEAINFIRNP